MKKESRYSLDIIDNYTEKQYNDYGWVRVNDVLTYRENADFRTKYGEIKRGKQGEVYKTANNEIIVAVNDQKQGRFGVDNVLVFAKGSYENYKITRVIKIKSDNETFLTEAREVVYECEKRGLQIKTSELFQCYNAENYRYDIVSENGSRSVQNNAQRSGERNGRRTSSKAGRYSIDVDSEGRELTKEQAEYFKDSKVRDENGNLLVVYHGTRKADFTVFKRNVNFFTDSIEMANSYSPNSEYQIGVLFFNFILPIYKLTGICYNYYVKSLGRFIKREIKDKIKIRREHYGKK